MNYTQLIDANWRIPYIGGWCEGYVEGAWGQASLPKQDNNGNWYTLGQYASAMAKWNANPGNGNHPGELPPVGKTVAVYFSLGSTSAGHTAISLDDGQVASSTQGGVHPQGYIHPNLQDLITMYAKYNNGCTYLGWSEYVGNIRVVQPVAAPQTQGDDMIDAATLKLLFNTLLNRDPDQGAYDHYVGNYTTTFVVNDLNSSQERANLLSLQQNTQAAVNQHIDALSSQVTSLTSQLTDLTAKDGADASAVADLTKQLSDTKTQLDNAQAALQAATSATVNPVPTTPNTPKETPVDLTPDQQQQINEAAQSVIDNNASDFVPAIDNKTKTYAYFVTDIASILSGLTFTVLGILHIIDPMIALAINAAIVTALLGTKDTFRISSK